jgi:hypothetical protein
LLHISLTSRSRKLLAAASRIGRTGFYVGAMQATNNASTTTFNTSTRFVASTLALSLMATATGCVSEDGDLGEDTGSTEQHASWASFAGWTTNGLSGNYDANIGSAAGMSCFLAGVGGNLSGDYHYTTPWAGVYRNSSNDWIIQARTGDVGAKLAVRALCLNVTAGRTAEVAWDGGADKVVAPVAAGRSCFLSNVRALWRTSSYFNLDWSSSTDEIRVEIKGSNWVIGGAGNARGAAYCISNVSWVGPEYYWHGTTGDLATNDQNPGTQCFLTGVRGRFRTNSFAEGEGVFIKYNDAASKYQMVVDGGKGGWARCIK